MATYKKRGSKINSPQQHSSEQESVTAEVFSTLDTSAGRAEAWVSRYQNYILSVICAAVVSVLAYLTYENYVIKPLEEESTNIIAHAQANFKQGLEDPTLQDSLFLLAIEGDGIHPGFIEIIDNYRASSAAQLATYNVGMIYFYQAEYDKAIDYLEDFSVNDPILSALALGGIGDSFVELNQLEDALNYYKKAAMFNDNELTSPRFLLKAAQVALNIGADSDAIELLESLKENYDKSPQAKSAIVLQAQVSQN
jgi:tetratricopeptide (TPR) repeat protein